MIQLVSQNVDFLFTGRRHCVFTGQFHAGDHGERFSPGSSQCSANTCYCIMIRKGKGSQSFVYGQIHDLLRGEGAVGKMCIRDRGSREPGQELVGTVSIVTDCGEVEIPYQIKVVREVIQTTSGVKVDDYYHLQRLLRENMEEGLEAFRSPRFKEVFLQRDEMGRILYDHLTRKNSKSQDVYKRQDHSRCVYLTVVFVQSPSIGKTCKIVLLK